MSDTSDNTPRPWRRRVTRALRLILWTACLALAGVGAVVFTPAGDWLGDRLIRLDPLERGDFIVVLGGDVERAVEAARLYREGWAPKVIVSSLGGDVEHYCRVLTTYGVPESAILRDRRSDRTAAHPVAIAALPGVDRQATRLIVVTSLFHTSRARACFVHDGYKHIAMQAPAWRVYQHDHTESSWAYRLSQLPFWARELAGWGTYKLRGWL
ncbi:MAG: YdcF family protein [Planctomycetota bacterium]|nr:YdcF family protein [Planctomycetota bacterium]